MVLSANSYGHKLSIRLHDAGLEEGMDGLDKRHCLL